MPDQSQQLYNVVITAERALHGHIANKRRKWVDRIVWFAGGMITWIMVYWRKVHVNSGLLEEGTRAFVLLEEGTREF